MLGGEICICAYVSLLDLYVPPPPSTLTPLKKVNVGANITLIVIHIRLLRGHEQTAYRAGGGNLNSEREGGREGVFNGPLPLFSAPLVCIHHRNVCLFTSCEKPYRTSPWSS